MPAFKFFLITFSITWLLWFVAAQVPSDSSSLVMEILFLPGTIVPALVALFLTWREGGSRKVSALVSRIIQWNVSPKWYVFALTFMAVVKLSVAVVHRIATGEWPRFGTEPWYLLLLAVLFSTWVQAGEELGWRGYALPRLAERFGLRGSSLLLGVLWATWHLPLFFIQGIDKTGQSFPVYMVQVTTISVAMAWLWQRTKGSLLLVMIMHASVNNSIGIVPSVVAGAKDVFSFQASLVSWLTAALLCMAAAYFLLDMKRETNKEY